MEGGVNLTDSIICTLGQYDIPIIQMQPPFEVDLLDSNIAVFGSSMNGKTNFLRLLINILHKIRNEKNEQIFILDFGGALSAYEKAPLVSAYFDNSNEEYVKRTFKILETLLNENTKKLDGKIFKNAEGDSKPIHTTFIIDNLNAFIDESRYFSYQEKFGRLCRDGSSKGISIVFTATETKGVGQYLLSFKQKIALNLPIDKYTELFNVKVEAAGNIPGRGYANVTVQPEGVTGTFQMNSPYEVQCFLAESIEEKNSEFVEKLNKKYGKREEIDFLENEYEEQYEKHVATRYKTFPQELRRTDYKKLKEGKEDNSPQMIEVGLDYVKCEPVSVDLNNSRVMAIYGKKEFGKTNLLSVLLEGVTKYVPNAKYIFFDDGRNQLSSFYDYYANKGYNCDIINQFQEVELQYAAGEFGESHSIRKKLSPIQQFYLMIHKNHMDLTLNYMDILESIYGRVYEDQIPKGNNNTMEPTVFIIQSKSVYINSKMNADFIHYLLPELLDVSEDRNYIFIFTDVKKITDIEVNSVFNSSLKSIFVLDNIAEFASERGGKTVFGDMDIKSLKEEYAKCELGDGYYYDVEADSLKKLKFIKNDWEDRANGKW